MTKKSNGLTSHLRTAKPDCFSQLKEYFEKTPKEELDREWKEINERYPNSPTVEDWLEYNTHNIQ